MSTCHSDKELHWCDQSQTSAEAKQAKFVNSIVCMLIAEVHECDRLCW